MGVGPLPRASAAEPVFVRAGSFGEVGSGLGELIGPHRLAIDPLDGDVLIADTSAGLIDVYRPTATGAEFLFSFGEGELVEPVCIAIDPATGDVYISDPGEAAIVKFDPDVPAAPTDWTPDPSFVSPSQGSEPGEVGSFGEVKAFGVALGAVAVDPTDGDLVLADPAGGVIDRFDPDGRFIGSFDGSTSGAPFALPGDLAIRADGTVLVSDLSETSARVLEFTSSGEFLGELGPVANGGPSLTGIALAVDPGDGDAFVGSKDALFGEPARIDRFSRSGTPIEETEDASLGGLVIGMAAGGGTPARLYAIATGSPFGTRSVEVFEAVEPPDVEIAPLGPEGVGASEASFSGTVDPAGAQVGECAFQYDTAVHFEAEGFAGADSVPCQPPPGTSALPVTASATGLEPATAYRVRLRATGRGGAAGVSATESFETVPVAPEVSTGKAWSITDTDATLAGTIDPRNSAVSTCRFEYGPTTAYGDSVPCAGPSPTGGSPVGVTADVSSLSAVGTYHFRLVALGVTGGERVGGDQTFVTRTTAESALLSRGYELVSAADTNGIEPLPVAASAEGDAYVYATFIPSPGASGGGKSFFRGVRRPDGSWTQTYIGTPAPPPGEASATATAYLFGSEGLGGWAFSTSQSLDPDDRNGSSDVYVGGPSEPTLWASRDPAIGGPQTDPGALGTPAYISPDGSRVFFESERHLLPSDNSEALRQSLYEWDAGKLSLVGLLPGETEGPTAGSELGSGGQSFTGTSYGAVSRDGSRVVFSSETEPLSSQLFLRIGGTRTIRVSKAAPGVEDVPGEPAEVTFQGADAEDRVIFFSSSSALTGDSGAEEGTPEGRDLYSYDVATGAIGDLTAGVEGGGLQRVYAVSEEGRRVYFTSTRQLVPGQGVAGEANLYLQETDGEGGPAGPPVFIATIDPEEAQAQRPQAWREYAASADGGVLAFRDRLSLVPGRVTGARPQVYVYEASTGSLSCASCPGDGSAPPASADLLPALPPAGAEEPSVDNLLNLVTNTAAEHITDVTSGGAVFFQTRSALVPTDTNGRIDVYEWHGGRLALVSAGAEAHDSLFGGASTDGDTVFFSSADGLVPGAQDGVPHMYAARVGGGAPAPLTEAPGCEGSDCRGPSDGPGPSAGLASAIPSGAAPSKPKRHRHRKPKKSHHRKHHAHHKKNARSKEGVGHHDGARQRVPRRHDERGGSR